MTADARLLTGLYGVALYGGIGGSVFNLISLLLVASPRGVVQAASEVGVS
ncbi:MAG TPA: hypothetical protein VFG60_07625 [Burkholderiaceae bacterium]|nr:hypothetical protein [Burkholderiaceae bacterium]